MAKACFQCGGSGKVHRSSMPHREGCIFCTTCVGCDGTGAIPDTASQCPKCHGQGRYHDSPMPHNPGCIFCTQCATCNGKGWI
jgi:DnaJ-class molecular chaperone